MRHEHRRIRVWDRFVRIFHWSLVLTGILAWSSAEEQAWLHERAVYFILALIGLRILWGLVGSHHVRFGEFLRGPRQTLAYLQVLRLGGAQRYPGHNPAGGWMVVSLLCVMLATGVSGALIGVGDPEFWEELHEGLAEFTLLLVVIHLAGVLSSSLLHRQNLNGAMWTGTKIRRNADNPGCYKQSRPSARRPNHLPSTQIRRSDFRRATVKTRALLRSKRASMATPKLDAELQ